MLPFVLSLVAILGGFTLLAWRSLRSSQRMAGALLSAAGLAAALWVDPARARLARERVVDRDMCVAAADEIERWGQSPPISPTGHLAQLIRASSADQPLAEVPTVSADRRVKTEEGLLVHELSTQLLTACLPEGCNDVRPPDELAIQVRSKSDDEANLARQRAARDVAAMLRANTCPVRR